MKFLIISKKENFNISQINDSLLDSVYAPSLIANNSIKKESNNLIVYLYTYNMAYTEREDFSYIFKDGGINFVNGLFAIENQYMENNLQNLNAAINEDKLILGNYQTFYCDSKGNGYLKSSLSTIHPIFLYEDENCTILSNELKLIVDGVKSFQDHKFVDLYDINYIQDLFKYGQWNSGTEKTSYRNTVFRNISRLFPFDDINIKNGQFDIKLNSDITIPDWFERLYLEDREQFYDNYYSYLENYADIFIKTISENLTQINLGLSGGFDSRLTVMMLSKFCSKYGIKLQAVTNGLPGHPDVIIAEEVAECLDVDWYNNNHGENELRYFPSSLSEYASTFYISQGDFDSHDAVKDYSREYLNPTEFYQHGNDLYKHDSIGAIMNISRWSSRRRLFFQDLHFPLFGTCLEIWTSFLNNKYSEFTYKEFIYNVLKRGNPELLEIPFANDKLPQIDVEEFKVEGYMDSRHKEEPFLWDYNFIHDRLDPLFKAQFIEQDERNDNIMSECGINSLDYFILKDKFDKILEEDLAEDKKEKKLKNTRKNAYYPLKRDFIDLKNYKTIYHFNKLFILTDCAAAADFNSFENLEKACSFNMSDDSLETIDNLYEKINELKETQEDLKKEINELKKERKNLKKDLKDSKKANKELLSSKSWKMTSVFRKLNKIKK